MYAGELQGPGLAMKVKAYDEKGKPIYSEQGELVCEAPAPSMPLYFWKDPEGEKYRAAYFELLPWGVASRRLHRLPSGYQRNHFLRPIRCGA